MFDGGDDQAPDRCALERQIIGFAAARGEHDHGGDRPHRPADGLTRVIEKCMRLAALRMNGGCIAMQLKCGEHCVSGTLAQRARGIMVKIYAHRPHFAPWVHSAPWPGE